MAVAANAKKYTSKGQRPNLTKKIINAARSEYLQSAERVMNQLHAFRKGKNVVVTIPNPDKNNTKARFIKIKGPEWFKNKDDFGYTME
jgi:hypothetical protein